MRQWRAGLAALLVSLIAPALAHPARKPPPQPPPLIREHRHPSGAFSFRTPEGWTVAGVPGNPELLEAAGDGVRVRFLHHPGEAGYDSLHVTCMMERLAGPMETAPQVKYEYDFVGGVVGDRRALDSAFAVRYDRPTFGHRDWRQRNVTIVGGGQSLCVIAHAPSVLWKKSPSIRTLLEAVLFSVALR